MVFRPLVRQLDASAQQVGTQLVVVLRGQLDDATRHIMVTAVAERTGPGVVDIVLDVRGLTSCDQSGLAAFVGLRQSAAREGKRLYLTDPSDQLAGTLDHAGLTNLAEPAG